MHRCDGWREEDDLVVWSTSRMGSATCNVGSGSEMVYVHLALLTSQLLASGSSIVTKGILGVGMNSMVYSFYCSVVAIAVLAPVAFFIDRKKQLKFSSNVIVYVCLLGFIFCGSQLLLLNGISNTSADFFSAMQPTVPVFATVIAIISRVEVVNWFQRDGQAKIVGILICSTGAALMTLYTGPCVIGHCSSVAQPELTEPQAVVIFGLTRWQLGAICIILYCLCSAGGGILQAMLLSTFPAPVSVSSCTLAIGATLMGIGGIFLVEDSSSWMLSWDENLLGVLFNGIFASAMSYGLLTWSISKVGPLLVACYIPAQPVVTSILSMVLLGTNIYLGSILGAGFIVIGLFLISWAREETFRLSMSSTKSLEEPLIAESVEICTDPQPTM